MTPYEAVNEITGMLLNGVNFPIKLPNRNFADYDANIFGELEFEHAGTEQQALVGMDQSSHTSVGVCVIDLFFALGEGVQTPYETTENVARIFRGKRSTSQLIWFRNVSHREVTRSRKPNRYQMTVTFTFQYDH